MKNIPEMNHFQNECQPIQEEIQPRDKEAPSSRPQDSHAQKAAGAKKCFTILKRSTKENCLTTIKQTH